MGQEIFVVAEHLKGALTDPTFEALGAARNLADALGGSVVGVVLGENAEEMGRALAAADRVLAVEHPALSGFTPEAYLAVLEPLLQEHQPRLTLFLNTAIGMDLAAALSARLNWPLVAYCTDLRAEDGKVVATSKIYGGKVLAECELPDGPGDGLGSGRRFLRRCRQGRQRPCRREN